MHYIEGSIGYVQIRNRLGRVLVQKTFRTAAELDFAFTPGTWRLVSFQRPCDGNCNYLDGPTDRCALLFRIRRSDTLSATVHVTPGSGCRIELR